MSILSSLVLACAVALASGAAVSLLLLLALNGLTKISQRMQSERAGSGILMPTSRLRSTPTANPHAVGSKVVEHQAPETSGT
jgi:hypothetical protein